MAAKKQIYGDKLIFDFRISLFIYLFIFLFDLQSLKQIEGEDNRT